MSLRAPGHFPLRGFSQAQLQCNPAAILFSATESSLLVCFHAVCPGSQTEFLYFSGRDGRKEGWVETSGTVLLQGSLARLTGTLKPTSPIPEMSLLAAVPATHRAAQGKVGLHGNLMIDFNHSSQDVGHL